jgi:hypothetical protein
MKWNSIIAIAASAAIGVGVAHAATEPVQSSAAQEKMHSDAIMAAIARAAGAKMAVEAYHLSQRSFPGTNAEVNLGAPDTYAGGSLRRLELQKDGQIQLVLGPDSGVNEGTIVLTPRASPQADQNTLEWTCETSSYPAIQDITGGACVYKK